MRNELNFAVEPFEAYSESDETSETFDTEFADLEGEEERSRGRRPGKRPTGSRAGLGRRPPLGRPPVPPVRRRPPRVRPWPPRPWPPRPWGPVVVVPEPGVPPLASPGPTAAPEGITPPEPSSEYVRWVQSTLNQIMALRLPVDGVMGPETRSAIRSFQKRHGLPVDGIVGPETERALIAAARGQPLKTGNNQPPQPEAFEAFDTELADLEWEGETDRSSREYVRWVQQSLNQLMGLRLAVDGIIGPMTRSAIRSFQQRQGLTVDGIVGSQTERALIAAGASNPSGGSTPSIPQPYVPVQPSTGTSALRSNIVRIAVKEWQRWGNGTITECESRIRPVLEDYWQTGAGWVPSGSNWCSTTAWSAAFISWVMRKAGAGNAFKYSSRHTDYVGAAKLNRLANNSNPFKTYRLSEVAPRVGDLVCKARAGSGVTYDNVDKGSYNSHCDIVTEVQPGKLITIGGNVSHSVKQTPVAINTSGRVTAPGYYAVVRVGP